MTAYKPNYDRFPAVKVKGNILSGWDSIINRLGSLTDTGKYLILADSYTGTHEDEITGELKKLNPVNFINTSDLFLTENEVRAMTDRFITDDTLFGYISNLRMEDFFDKEKLAAAKGLVSSSKGLTVVYGPGAAMLSDSPDLLLYFDMPRWEIIQRFRKQSVKGLGVDNGKEPVSHQYKRGYFNDWNICDLNKRALYGKVDYWIDTTVPGKPKMIDRATFTAGMANAVKGPFRVVPFFDPAPWGGQWMKEKFGLEDNGSNYGWCFDCVPEENSLFLEADGERFEMPSVNAVFSHAREMLGEAVEARFGDNFPIRFDYLDTMGGGNLSVQVHPTSQYAHRSFGLQYTQDESYYLLDAGEGSTVYLGLKEGIDNVAMIDDLKAAQKGEITFDTEKYVNVFPAKKHDHFLIPSGTVHCSGSNAVVLEISSTPNLFTFKLWDWGRLGLDGKPRPLNIERGSEVIDWSRDTSYAREHLVNVFEPVEEGEGWWEERTGLHRNEFIETRRHWFTEKTTHHTNGSVNVLNLAEGREVIVESPDGTFEPYVVHYGETFIVPACVGSYTVRPYGEAEGTECVTLKAYVRV